MGNMIKVAEVSDIPVGGVKKVSLEDVDIAIFNIGGELYAISDTCTHEQASLSEGDLDGDSISCPRHGATYNIKTGEAIGLPAIISVATYRVKIEGNDIILEMPNDK